MKFSQISLISSQYLCTIDQSQITDLHNVDVCDSEWGETCQLSYGGHWSSDKVWEVFFASVDDDQL